MNFPRLLSFLLIGFLAFAPAAHAAGKKKKHAESTYNSEGAYKGAIAIDAATGKVLFEDHATEVNPPASVTKLMTFLIVHDKIQQGALKKDTPVTVTVEDSKIGGTQVWLKEKEIFTVDELLYALMIQSANDAATALARTAAGSREAFVALMNAKARELGMTNTTFRSPHGLPPSSRKLSESDVSCPRDIALLSRELLLKTDILSYTLKEKAFGVGKRAEPVMMRNHNHLLGKVAGVDGLKTGFTNGAGFCLSATAARNGQRIIVVVMGSTASKSRDLKVAELIEHSFSVIPADSKWSGGAANASPVSGSPATDSSPVAASSETGTTPAPAAAKDDSLIKFPPVPKK